MSASAVNNLQGQQSYLVNPGNLSPIVSLPYEVMIRILQQCDHPRDIYSLCSVNRRWAELGNNELFWKVLLLRDFGSEALPPGGKNYKGAYKAYQIAIRKCLKKTDLKLFDGAKDPSFHLEIERCHIKELLNQALLSNDSFVMKTVCLLLILGSIPQEFVFEAINLLCPKREILERFNESAVLLINYFEDDFGKISDDLEEARRQIAKIDNEVIRSIMYQKIIDKYLSLDNAEEAKKIAALIPEYLREAFELEKIVDAFLKGEHDCRSEILSKLALAEKWANKIPCESIKFLVLVKIADKYFELNAFDDTLRIANSLPELTKIGTLIPVIEDLVEKGNYEEALRIFTTFPVELLKIKLLKEKLHSLIANKGLTVAESIIINSPKGAIRDKLLKIIAKQHLKRENFHNAIRISDMISDETTRVKLLKDISLCVQEREGNTLVKTGTIVGRPVAVPMIHFDKKLLVIQCGVLLVALAIFYLSGIQLKKSDFFLRGGVNGI